MTRPLRTIPQDENPDLVTLTKREYRNAIWGARFDGFVVGLTATFLIALGLIVFLRL